MRPLLLTAATSAVLAFIRRTEFPLSVYGRSAARVEPLAAALELCVRKWTNLSLAPELLQQLLCDCHWEFHAWGPSPEFPELLEVFDIGEPKT